MVYVITEKCVGTCDTVCVDACPVDAIHSPIRLDVLTSVPKEQRGQQWPGLQLFINPDECICCGACAPECPVQAIYPMDEVPLESRDSIERNARFFAR